MTTTSEDRARNERKAAQQRSGHTSSMERNEPSENENWRNSSRSSQSNSAMEQSAESNRQNNVTENQQRKSSQDESQDNLQVIPLWSRPFAMMQQFSEEMDHLFESLLLHRTRGLSSSRSSRLGLTTSLWSPQIDIRENDDNIVICADLPGINKDNVKVEINSGLLTIQGERKEERESKEQGYRRMERRYGSFYRTIPLPEGVNMDAVHAQLQNGVLEIKVPAPKADKQGRQIEIKSGEIKSGNNPERR